jgi:hypothetical protein
VTQHAALSDERWAAFSLDQQVLMIANEMHRASKLLGDDDRDLLHSGYARVLNLTDATLRVQRGHGLRRELLRWRDLVAALYVAPESRPGEHYAALRALLQLCPAAAKQIPFIATP